VRLGIGFRYVELYWVLSYNIYIVLNYSALGWIRLTWSNMVHFLFTVDRLNFELSIENNKSGSESKGG
jgi:hypothetical protein